MLNRLTPVVKNLVIINVLVFLAQGALPHIAPYFMGFFPLSLHFEPWQIISHMFMHADFTHIFFNMFGIIVFGSSLERVWGSKRFLIFYMFTGLGAFALHYGVIYYQLLQIQDLLKEPQLQEIYLNGYDVIRQGKAYMNPTLNQYNLLLNIPVVGASGALFGLLFGFGKLFPNTKLYLLFLPIGIKAKYVVIIYGVLEISRAISNSPGDNIAHFAHLGGMLFGYILIKNWQQSRTNFY